MRPLLHHLVSCVSAPALALSEPDGQVRPGGVQGWFRGDRRMLSSLTLTVDGREPEGLRGSSTGASAASFTAVARHVGDVLDDPSVRVDRTRALSCRRLVESITVSSSAQTEVHLEVVVQVSSDLAPMARVRTGERPGPVPAEARADGFAWVLPDDERADVPATEPLSVVLRCDPRPDDVDAAHGSLRWRCTLPARGALAVHLNAEVHGQETGFTAPDLLPWSVPQVDCADVRVPALVGQGVDDLGGLLLRDDGTADHFLAAGTPWFLTLFGRDSLWAARMLLPLGTDLAMSTLRTLARRQGTRDDPETEEQPGKILHEVRAGRQVLGELTLPPVYYGTVDATPLFVVLLADAWRWGADPAQVEALLPHARLCLGWMEQQARDGFLRYVDKTGHGLANQGWKDSPDGVQWADGTLAEPPIALSEAQGYAYQAAVLGADLFDAFGVTGAQHWRDWAHRLAVRFRDAFWVEDDRGRYPAVALDRDGRAVDSVASNMGHLLGTGLLDRDETGVVADRLGGADMDSGFGLRTLTSRSPRYSALSYHGGSVWPHDTAIAVHGLCREGHRERAVALLRGLVAAAPAFDYRLPELYSGDEAGPMRAPAPYPSACRPQAWAAAAPLWALVSVLGVEVDAPGGVLRVPARVDTGLGPLAVHCLRVGGHRLDVEVGADGAVAATTRHPHLEVLTGP